MGKVILYVGLAMLVFGTGSLLILLLFPAIDADSTFGFGFWALLPFWPGVILTALGSLICLCKYLWDKLPY